MAQRHQPDDMYLLCVEPGTNRLFSINQSTHEAELIELKKGHSIENKLKREEYKLDILLDRDDHQNNWFFTNETVNNYRRQMVPFYLLEQETNQYPTYIDNSNIDQSLTEDQEFSI